MEFFEEEGRHCWQPIQFCCPLAACPIELAVALYHLFHPECQRNRGLQSAIKHGRPPRAQGAACTAFCCREDVHAEAACPGCWPSLCVTAGCGAGPVPLLHTLPRAGNACNGTSFSAMAWKEWQAAIRWAATIPAATAAACRLPPPHPPTPLFLPLQPYHLKTFFSNKYAYAQIVRMADGHIVAAASTVEPQTKEALAAAGTSLSCSQAASR